MGRKLAISHLCQLGAAWLRGARHPQEGGPVALVSLQKAKRGPAGHQPGLVTCRRAHHQPAQ